MKIIVLVVNAMVIGALAGTGVYLVILPTLTAPIYSLESWPDQATFVAIGAALVVLIPGVIRLMIEAVRKNRQEPPAPPVAEPIVVVKKPRVGPRMIPTAMPVVAEQKPSVLPAISVSIKVDEDDDHITESYENLVLAEDPENVLEKSEEQPPAPAPVIKPRKPTEVMWGSRRSKDGSEDAPTVCKPSSYQSWRPGIEASAK